MAVPPGQDSQRIEIEYPAEILADMTKEQLQRLAREAFYVRLYQEGKISSGRAATLLGMTRSDFLDVLGRYNVSYFDEQTDLSEDVRNAEQARS